MTLELLQYIPHFCVAICSKRSSQELHTPQNLCVRARLPFSTAKLSKPTPLCPRKRHILISLCQNTHIHTHTHSLSLAYTQSQNFGCSILHGDLQGEERDATMDEFRSGRNKVLLLGCTLYILSISCLVVCTLYLLATRNFIFTLYLLEARHVGCIFQQLGTCSFLVCTLYLLVRRYRVCTLYSNATYSVKGYANRLRATTTVQGFAVYAAPGGCEGREKGGGFA